MYIMYVYIYIYICVCVCVRHQVSFGWVGSTCWTHKQLETHGCLFSTVATDALVLKHEATRAPSQYPKRRLFVRSRKVSKPRDLYLELSDRSEIWQALRQHCCRCACQISKRYDNSKYQSRGFETSRDLTIRRHFGYWDGALYPQCWLNIHYIGQVSYRNNTVIRNNFRKYSITKFAFL